LANYTEPFQAALDYAWPKIQFNGYKKKENTLILWLRENAMHTVGSFGEYITIPFQYGHTDDSVDVAADAYATVSTTAISDQDRLKFQNAAFLLPIIGSNYQIEVQVGTDSNVRIYDNWKATLASRGKAANRILSDGLFSDGGATTATDIYGLRYHLDQTDTTYGGLTRAATGDNESLWPVEDTTTTTITWGAMINAIMDCSGDTEAIFTTKDIMGFVWTMRQAQERYDPSPAGKVFEDVGAEYINVSGRPLVWDERCPDDHMFGLAAKEGDEQSIHYFQHRTWDMQAQKIVDTMPTQEARVGRIKWAGQLCFSRCDNQFAMTAITA
jgi:hypothetical protein